MKESEKRNKKKKACLCHGNLLIRETESWRGYQKMVKKLDSILDSRISRSQDPIQSINRLLICCGKTAMNCESEMSEESTTGANSPSSSRSYYSGWRMPDYRNTASRGADVVCFLTLSLLLVLSEWVEERKRFSRVASDTWMKKHRRPSTPDERQRKGAFVRREKRRWPEEGPAWMNEWEKRGKWEERKREELTWETVICALNNREKVVDIHFNWGSV